MSNSQIEVGKREEEKRDVDDVLCCAAAAPASTKMQRQDNPQEMQQLSVRIHETYNKLLLEAVKKRNARIQSLLDEEAKSRTGTLTDAKSSGQNEEDEEGERSSSSAGGGRALVVNFAKLRKEKDNRSALKRERHENGNGNTDEEKKDREGEGTTPTDADAKKSNHQWLDEIVSTEIKQEQEDDEEREQQQQQEQQQAKQATSVKPQHQEVQVHVPASLSLACLLDPSLSNEENASGDTDTMETAEQQLEHLCLRLQSAIREQFLARQVRVETIEVLLRQKAMRQRRLQDMRMALARAKIGDL